MKKILSMLVIAVMLVSTMAFTALAADIDFVLSVDKTEANKGDVIIATVSVTDTAGIKAMGAGVKFDSAFVLGSEQASEDDYGAPTWVGYDYLEAYYGLTAGKRWGDPTFGADTTKFAGYTYANAQYAKAKAVTSSTADLPVCGVILVVDTDEAKEVTLSMPESYWGDANGVKTTIPEKTVTIKLNGYGNAPVDPVVTYEGETNVVWGAKGEYAEGKATFSVKPVMGYTIAVTANGEAVAIDAAKGGEVTIDVTEDTTVVATATAITDGAYTYGETYKDGNTVYVFGKAAVAPFGFYVEKDGAALANKALEIYDGKFAANGTAGAFGMAFTFTGKGHTGAYTAKAYDANGTADTFASFNID